MRKSNEKNQGITLIALIVTIIVLLILAGITLSLVAGSDGILSRATNAVDKHEIASIKENVELKIAEDVERFHEEKYVDFSIDNAMTAYEYLNENTDKVIQKGNEKYTITYTNSTDPSKPDDNKIQVDYVKKGTKLSITGKISQTGVIIWDEDVEISGGNTGGSGTGGSGGEGDSGETEKDILLSISEPTWNGTNGTVTVTGKKEGATLQYKVGDGEWQDIESGATVTFLAGTKVEACFFDGTNREIVSQAATLSYTVAYDGNGATSGSTANSLHEYGVAKELNSNGFAKDGFSFKGWNISADGTGQAFEDGASVMNLSSINGATVTLFAQWEEDKKPAISVIAASNYGDLVNYSANGVDDWKIFLNDGTYIYIIASDIVPTAGIELYSGVKLSGDYGVLRTSVGSAYTWTANSSYWNSFATGISGSVAWGGPTHDQFKASTVGKYGYTFSTNGSNIKNGVKGDPLYFPHDSLYNGCSGYIVVKVPAVYAKGMWVMMFSGKWYWAERGSEVYGIRPLVRLPGGINVSKGSDGKWTFSQ